MKTSGGNNLPGGRHMIKVTAWDISNAENITVRVAIECPFFYSLSYEEVKPGRFVFTIEGASKRIADKVRKKVYELVGEFGGFCRLGTR